jgi:alkanesulfonate monooxygenase SsuD/methylene tetrahydromethanopterin reductase-like flavin-dependent oxidoreductase (luciferase family)
MAVAAVVDETNLAVETLELRIGQSELDRREDPVAVGPDGPRELDERGDATAARPRQPPVEMQRRVLRVGKPVEVAQALLELPAAVEH